MCPGARHRFAACDIVLLRADLEDAERVRPYVEALAAGAPSSSVRTECVAGDAAGAIVRTAEREPEAVVCMATHGRGRIAGPLLGSVATEVLRAIETPVLLVGPHCTTDWWHEPPHLVACWTGDASNPLLPLSRSWSHDLGMDLSLVCVFHPLDLEESTYPDAQFASARAALDDGGPNVNTVALHDDFPPGAIADYARTRPASLLALTTRARHGLSRAVLGSVAMEVVHRSPCPVLAVRASA